MFIVSNTTPIISLLKINQIELLKNIFGEITIPEAVYNEICCKKGTQEVELFKSCSFIKKKAVKNEFAVKLMRKQVGLDAGESEAIVLASELGSTILVIDELKGRKVASEMGLKIIGTLGLLLKSKQIGLIPEIKPLLEVLIENDIRIGVKLYEYILKEAGEK